MQHVESVALSLQPEEHRLLLDTLTSTLAELEVEIFRTTDSVPQARLQKRRLVIKEILMKLQNIRQDGEGEGESKEKSKEVVQGKAA